MLIDDHLRDLLFTVRAVQIPLLAALLLGACAAKARRAISTRSIEAGIGPTAMFPIEVRRPIAIAVFAAESVFGAGLLITAGRMGAGMPALVIRSGTALLFVTALAALYVLRSRQPDVGCGCFGDISDTPVTWQALARSALLCAAAIATIGAAPLHLAASPGQAVLVLGVLVAELVALAALSPEIGEIMVRLGYSEPCEVRRVPVSRTLAALRASAHWRRYRRYVVSPDEPPLDVWREGCWRYVVFPGMLASRRVEVVFAVYLKPRRAPVRAGIFDATADRRSRAAVEGAGGAGGVPDVITAPRRTRAPLPAPVTVRTAPALVSAKPPHNAPYRMPHAAYQAHHHRHRHSADL